MNIQQKIKINETDNTKCSENCPYLDKYYKEYNGKMYITHEYCSLFNDIKIIDNKRTDRCKDIK